MLRKSNTYNACTCRSRVIYEAISYLTSETFAFEVGNSKRHLQSDRLVYVVRCTPRSRFDQARNEGERLRKCRMSGGSNNTNATRTIRMYDVRIHLLLCIMGPIRGW